MHLTLPVLTPLAGTAACISILPELSGETPAAAPGAPFDQRGSKDGRSRNSDIRTKDGTGPPLGERDAVPGRAVYLAKAALRVILRGKFTQEH